MKFVLCVIVVLFVGCSSNQSTTVDGQSATNETTVSDTATSEKPSTQSVDSDGSEFVIDVRSQDEWDSGHVQKAVHIPHTQIAERIAEVTEKKDAKIVIYCAVGGRAGTAKTALEKLGYTNVINAGGFDDIKTKYE
ncbi:MAG: rhodanese-like domain-containing protein [Pirellulaceae bacterium]